MSYVKSQNREMEKIDLPTDVDLPVYPLTQIRTYPLMVPVRMVELLLIRSGCNILIRQFNSTSSLKVPYINRIWKSWCGKRGPFQET